MKYTCVIWDFNGTIFDDVQIGIESINTLLGRRGLPLISGKEEYQSGFMFPIVEWYKNMGFDFDKESYDIVAEEWVKEYLSREHLAKLVSGVFEAINFFKNNGIKQVILSVAETSMLKRQLSELGIIDYFEEVIGLDNIKAAGKKDIAISWRKEHSDDKLLFIGDTDHDHQVAVAIDADCILVSAGHQSYERLSKLTPTLAVLESPKEIIKLF